MQSTNQNYTYKYLKPKLNIAQITTTASITFQNYSHSERERKGDREAKEISIR